MIYLVDVPSNVLIEYNKKYPTAKPNVLVSYARQSLDTRRNISTYRNLIGSLILDSGTYTRENNREKYEEAITLAGYMKYLSQHESRFDFYFNFDEDYSREGFETNMANQRLLEDEGYRPIPVIHDCYGEEVRFYIDEGYDCVAIGSGELKNEGYQELYRIVDELASQEIKVHFLGSTEYLKMANVPIYSADSDTWNQAAWMGRLLYWNANKHGHDKTEKIKFSYGQPERLMKRHIDTHPHQLEIANYLHDELGYSIDDLKDPGGLLCRQVANVHFYVQMERRIATVHRELGYKYWV